MALSRRGAALLAMALLVGACGSDDDTSTASSSEDATDPSTESATDEPEETGAVSNVQDVRSATVQIVAQGSFAEPSDSFAAYEEYEAIGSGSGFIIDPSGIAVTNNHVVTGAATSRC